jgi:ABC-type multidrug transport system ATPase subunit
MSVQSKRLAVVCSVGAEGTREAFINDMAERYQAMNGSTFAPNSPYGPGFRSPLLRSVYLPGFSDVFARELTYESELEDYIRSNEYPSHSHGKIFAAIVFHSGGPQWRYSIRMNGTQFPDTNKPFISSSVNYVGEYMFQYMYSSYVPDDSGALFGGDYNGEGNNDVLHKNIAGFSMLQTMVDRWIINVSETPYTAPGPNQQETGALPGSSFLNVLGGVFYDSVSQEVGQAFWDDLYRTDGDNVDWEVQRQWQYNVTAAAWSWARGDTYLPQDIFVFPMPLDASKHSDFYYVTQWSLPFIFVIAYIFPVSRLIRSIVVEKELRLTESLRILSVPDTIIMASWVATHAISMLTVSAAIGGILSVGIYSRSGFWPPFVLFSLFGCASVSYAILCSVFFSASRTAAVLGGVAYLMGFFPYYAVGTTTADGSRAAKIAVSIFPPSAFAITLNHVSASEAAGRGVDFGPSASDVYQGFAFQDGLLMLTASTFAFTILAWYADKVLPASMRQYGVPRPFYFLCQPSYWRSSSQAGQPSLPTHTTTRREAQRDGNGPVNATAHTNAGEPATILEELDAAERAKAESGRCISIQGLTKSFPTPDGPKIAVDKLKACFLEGQISVLLGPNGCGKTTTISMLTGLISPSTGTASVYGHDLRNDLEHVRQGMGICPQVNSLWPELTVQEHMRLFCALKGSADAPHVIETGLADVGLADKAYTPVNKLSGGQQRKLCVALALVGGSKVVILDEPTSGMDPYSRRATWQLLQKAREGRVIILTTHFMDEADVLGDRIAFMRAGAHTHACVIPPCYSLQAFILMFVCR